MKKNNQIQNSKRCIFSTGNDSYVPHAIVSLLSFKKFNPEFDAYIFCTDLSQGNRNLCAYCGIKPIELDLSEFFYIEWQYPRECFYHFKGPEILYSMGYEYSVYIDGDTYCSNKFQWNFDENFDIAGISYNSIGEFFNEIGDYSKILNSFKLSGRDLFKQPRVQSGVLIYNNRALTNLNFFEKICYLFDQSIKENIPRKGDDSLLALFTAYYAELEILILNSKYNFIDYIHNVSKEQIVGDVDGEVISNCIIYHFINNKPWFLSEYYLNYSHKYFTFKWLEVMINNFSQDDIKRCYPDFYKSDIIDSSRIRFYWFKFQPNFGDWITPYFVKKICGKDALFTDPLETKDNVIISTGSIMRLCGPNTIVWGSGIRDRYQDIKTGKLIRSTRGPITRTRILEIGGECPPIYGDPALLLSRFYSPERTVCKYRLGIIPHISQFEKVRNIYADEEDVNVIDLRTKNVEIIVDRVLQCESIVSSSLHGIIVANAYNIPVKWIQFDTNIFGDNTKFYDHFASIGRPEESFINALYYRKISPEELIKSIIPYKIEIDLDKLWDASIFYKGDFSKYTKYLLSS